MSARNELPALDFFAILLGTGDALRDFAVKSLTGQPLNMSLMGCAALLAIANECEAMGQLLPASLVPEIRRNLESARAKAHAMLEAEMARSTPPSKTGSVPS